MWRKAGWSALTLLMFLGFLEILARRTGGREEHRHIQMDFDADLMWGLSNQRVNSFGLRGDEPAEGVRLLTLGDSSIYGHGVAPEEVFSARVPGVVSIIGGVPGYSTFQSIKLLERVGPRLHPDIVLIGNLWSDAYRAAISDRAWSAELAATYGPWRPITTPLEALSRRSALARRLRKAVHDGFFPDRARASEVGWSHLVAAAPGTPVRPPVKGGAAALPTSRVPIDEYEANLRTLAASARALGAVPAYLVLPHPMDPLPPQEENYRAVMRRVASEEGTIAVDAAAWFRAHPADGRFSDDIHPSAKGHADIATAVAEAFAGSPEIAAKLR